jgi:hypothetical protein
MAIMAKRSITLNNFQGFGKGILILDQYKPLKGRNNSIFILTISGDYEMPKWRERDLKSFIAFLGLGITVVVMSVVMAICIDKGRQKPKAAWQDFRQLSEILIQEYLRPTNETKNLKSADPLTDMNAVLSQAYPDHGFSVVSNSLNPVKSRVITLNSKPITTLYFVNGGSRDSEVQKVVIAFFPLAKRLLGSTKSKAIGSQVFHMFGVSEGNVMELPSGKPEEDRAGKAETYRDHMVVCNFYNDIMMFTLGGRQPEELARLALAAIKLRQSPRVAQSMGKNPSL